MNNNNDDVDVRALTPRDLDQLTDEQANYVRNQALLRRNPEITRIVNAAMTGQEQDVVASLSRSPFAYLSPEMEVSGVKVRFRSLYKFQTRDVNERTQKYMDKKRPSDFLVAEFMNQMFLVHAIETLNGEPLGSAQLGEGLIEADDEQREKALDAFVAKRMRALDVRPQSLISALVSANQVFQERFDDVVCLRGSSPDAIRERAEKIVAAVGKSTGPQVAGQKPT